jgi:hypothetical protein
MQRARRSSIRAHDHALGSLGVASITFRMAVLVGMV